MDVNERLIAVLAEQRREAPQHVRNARARAESRLYFADPAESVAGEPHVWGGDYA